MAVALFATSMAHAQGAAPAPAAPDLSWQDKLTKQTGVIVLSGGEARLNLGPDYYFLNPADSRKVLVEGWGNPPGAADGVLGMIFPARFKPLEKASWGAVISYEDTGYVSDRDASKTNPDKLLEGLRKNEDANNVERQKAGYESIHLAGWAEQPNYNPQKHVAIWAQDLQFGGAAQHTLNYDIRLLGRRGVLSLNVVAALSDLPQVKAAADSVASQAQFEPGSRYGDYQKGQDKVAEYGVAGLIAAGVGVAAAKKLGLLALIAVFAKKGIVLIIAGFAAAANWVRKLFGAKTKDSGRPGSGPDLVS